MLRSPTLVVAAMAMLATVHCSLVGGLDGDYRLAGGRTGGTSQGGQGGQGGAGGMPQGKKWRVVLEPQPESGAGGGGASGELQARVTDIAVMDGGVVLAGWYRGAGLIARSDGVSTSCEPKSVGGGQDWFAIRLDEDGVTAWCHAFGGAGDDQAHAVAVHGERVFVAGGCRDLEIIGALLGSEGACIVELDGVSGEPARAVSFQSGQSGEMRDLDADGDWLFAAGVISGPNPLIEYAGPWPPCATLGPGSTSNELLVMRLSPDADTCDVGRFAATGGEAEGFGITSLGNAESVAVGRFDGTLDGVASSGSDGFVSLLDGALQLSNTTALGGPDYDLALGSVRDADDVIVIGSSDQALDQCLPANASNTPTGFVVRYGPDLQSCDGVALIRRMETSDSIAAIATSLDEVIVIGDYDGSVTLDNATVMPLGARDGFVSRIDAPTLQVLATTYMHGAPESEIFLEALAVDPAGRVLVGGSCASPAAACLEDCALGAQCGFAVEP